MKVCIYYAHLCRCIDVHASLHVLPLIKACQHVHICCSSPITHAVLFLCKQPQELHIYLFMHMCIHATGIEGICMQKYTYSEYLLISMKISMSEVRSYAHAQMFMFLFIQCFSAKDVCMAVHAHLCTSSSCACTNPSTYACTYPLQ